MATTNRKTTTGRKSTAGRKTTNYRKKYCDDVIRHFSAMRKNKKGKIVGLPSFVSFAEEVNVTPAQLEKWRREHTDFDKACRDATEMLRQLLMDASLSEEVNVSAAKYILSHEFGMQSSSHKGQATASECLSDADRRLIENLMRRLGIDTQSD